MRTKASLLITLTLLMCAGAHVTKAQRGDTTSVTIQAPVANYESPKQYVVKEITVHGVKYQDPEFLANSVGLHKGDTAFIPSDYITQAANKLWSTKYFSDVKIMGVPLGGDDIRLEIYLKERQRVYNWNISGVRKGQKSELLDNLTLRRGSELSPYNIERSEAAIKRYFQEKGYLDVTVTPIIKQDTTIQNAATVNFAVDKKHKVKIGSITFDGNQAFSDSRLRAAMKKTHQKSWKLWQSTKLDKKEYVNDKENVIDYYNSKGYRNAHIISDSVYRINDKRLGVKMSLEEGNKYYIRNISWVGNSLYPTELLADRLGIRKGDTYDKKKIQKQLGIGKEMNIDDSRTVTAMYQNEGYLMFQIDPAETVVGADSIDLEIKIFEGNPFTVNEVNISGNMRVDDDVIRRELRVMPGELYDREMLMNTLRLLSQMQHFYPEALQPDVQPVTNSLVNISFPLQEQPSDKFEISGGWGQGMFVGSVGIQLNNFSAKNIFKGKEWRPYPGGQSQQLAIRAQSNGSYYQSYSLSFTEPWLGGRKPNSLTVGTYYSDETNAYYLWQKGTKSFQTIGVSAGLGFRLNWPDHYFTLYSELSYQRYNMHDWDYFLITNGSSNIFTFKTILGRSTVNNPIFPSHGSDLSVALTLTPPYSLFDKLDYSSGSGISEQQRYRWIEYHKWQLKAAWYYPLTANNKLVLMARAEMGYIGAYNPNKPSPFEGFELGGDGMSGYNVYGVDVVGLRGYSNGSLTTPSTSGNYAHAYNKYTLEVRYPFLMQQSTSIYGLAFAEGGNSFASWQTFDPFLLKRSAGVGVRMYLPMVGMIGFDWGFGFDKIPGETKRSGGQPHFMIGMQF